MYVDKYANNRSRIIAPLNMITPIPLLNAELLCKSWGGNSRMYTMDPSREVACVGFCVDNDTVAIALFERIDDRLFVWDITCTDTGSGSRLVRAMTRQQRHTFTFGHTVHPRWRIARAYYDVA